MKWRPEGWDEIVERLTADILDIEGHDGDPRLVEAGADAMLEALSKLPETGTWLNGFRLEGQSGKRYIAVFIPDDKEE
jgi:hypothetical protein